MAHRHRSVARAQERELVHADRKGLFRREEEPNTGGLELLSRSGDGEQLDVHSWHQNVHRMAVAQVEEMGNEMRIGTWQDPVTL